MELCDSVAPHYSNVNRDLLLTGVLLHDIGKLEELQYASAFGYSTEGQLLGHIAIGLRMIHEKLSAMPDFPVKLRTLVEHMVLSHHGHLEFGSPKLPMTPEAMMLHMLDDLDAKMQAMRSEFDKHQSAGNDGAKMTDWVRAMERPLLDSNAYLKEAAEAGSAEGVKAEIAPEIAVQVSKGFAERLQMDPSWEIVKTTTVVETAVVRPADGAGVNSQESVVKGDGLFVKD
jgi:3'-5' exoribonuclease